MISFITTGRDDDYGGGGNFLDRLYISLSKNIEILERFNVEYEYLVVEWSPIKNYLINNEKFRQLFLNKNLIDVVVKSNVAVSENLNSNKFFEYFAKNVGVRISKYEVLILLNSDIIIPPETMREIINLFHEKHDEKHFYRLINRVQIDINLNILKRECIHYPNNPDAIICGYCSGDILIINKNFFIESGDGYDETNMGHRVTSQTGMDGEILWNLHHKGITLMFLQADYWHINHSKIGVHTDGIYNTNGYVNKPNWGFINYPKNIISKKLIEIG
jgi:hypothetical protein